MDLNVKCITLKFLERKRKYLEPWTGQNDVRHDKKKHTKKTHGQ